MKLSDVSPLAAMATGKGGMGKLMAQGFGGLIPMAIAKDAIRRRAEEEAAAKAASVGGVGTVGTANTAGTAGAPMKKGGSVKGWGKARGARKAKMY